MTYSIENVGETIPTGIISSVGNFNSGSCALFLLSPRQIVPHFKRPLIYNFNNELIESVSENIMNHPSHSGSIRKVLNTTQGINTAIVPSGNEGINVSTDAYSSHWMFVLITDDAPSSNIHLANKFNVRSISIGICASEPISHSGMMSATPEQFLNPNCQLVETKLLQMTKYNTANVGGYTEKIGTTSNNNIVHFDQNLWHGPRTGFDNSSFFSLMPNNVKNAVISDDRGEVTTCIDHADSLNVTHNARLTASLESPVSHMNEILTAFETGASNALYAENIVGNDESFGYANDRNSIIRESVNNAFDASYTINTPSHLSQSFLSDRSTTYMTIGMVVAKYHPKVFPVVTPNSSAAEIMPQHYSSVNNIFSSLVCSVLPTLLSKVGLASLSFFYNSPNNAFKVLHIDSVISLPQQVLASKWNEITVLLRTELFPVLYGNCGSFDLQAMCSVSGTTDVILNFLDFEPVPVGVIYQENTVLGGVVSPLVGTGDQLKHNAMQLNQLITNVSGRTAPGPNY